MFQFVKLTPPQPNSSASDNCAKALWWSLAGATPIIVWTTIGLCAGKLLDYCSGYPGKDVFLGLKMHGTAALASGFVIGAICTLWVICSSGFGSKEGSIEDAKNALCRATAAPAIVTGRLFCGCMQVGCGF